MAQIKTRFGTIETANREGVITDVRDEDKKSFVKDGIATILAADTNYGLIKSSANAVVEGGILTKINVNLLFQNEGEYVILHSGDAATFNDRKDNNLSYYLETNKNEVK